ncbi:hypothetical protein [Runella sp.]|uniref:hypothetical protein n=1 Tax=Runella sp. TaxID=1960881 RepID=UPI003D0A5DF6
MASVLNILTSQITTLTNGKPFDQWDLSSFDPVKETLYDYLAALSTTGGTQEVRGIGYAIKKIPANKYTTEEICLILLLINNPAHFGINEAQAEYIITSIRLAILDNVSITQRETQITNLIGQEVIIKKQIEAGTYNVPETPLKENEGAATPQGSKFDLWASIQAALKSPVVWLLLAFVLFKLYKNRKSK